MALNVAVAKMTGSEVVLQSELARMSTVDGRISITLSGAYSQAANTLDKTTVYLVTVTDDEGVVMSSLARFLSYNFLYSLSSTQDSTMVITDNTLLFEQMR